MPDPKQPAVRRSGYTPLTPDPTQDMPTDEPTGSAAGRPVPPENEPGHRPAVEQDRPDPDAVAESLGVTPAEPALWVRVVTLPIDVAAAAARLGVGALRGAARWLPGTRRP